MQKELIRASHSIEKRMKSFSPVVIQTLDLLENDRSLLTTEQWRNISNLIHSFDRINQISQIKEQMSLNSTYPVRIQLKIIREQFQRMILSMYQTIEQFLHLIPEFERLSSNDQLCLVERNIRTLGGINAFALSRDLQIHRNPFYVNLAISIFGYDFIQPINHLINQLDDNILLSKLLIPIFLFSTSSDVISPRFTNSESEFLFTIEYRCFILMMKIDQRINYGGNLCLSDPIYLFELQNIYVEILYKYMLYHYGYSQSAIRFSNIIKTYLDHHYWSVNHNQLENHDQMIDQLSQQIQQNLIK